MAQQSISQIRTVVAYNGEKHAYREYEEALVEPVKVREEKGRGEEEMGLARLPEAAVWLMRYWGQHQIRKLDLCLACLSRNAIVPSTLSPQVGIRQSVVAGVCQGSVHAIVFWTYALAFIYGEQGRGEECKV